MKYSEARALLSTARDPLKGKPITNNTRLFSIDIGGAVVYVIRLHRTDIVQIHPDGTYVLDTGGWKTVTTKERLTSYSPAIIRQSKGEWFVNSPSSYDCETGRWTNSTPFIDGTRVDAHGNPIP